jgi:hypothetical protein
MGAVLCHLGGRRRAVWAGVALRKTKASRSKVSLDLLLYKIKANKVSPGLLLYKMKVSKFSLDAS